MDVRHIEFAEDLLVEAPHIGHIESVVERVGVQALHDLVEVTLCIVVEGEHVSADGGLDLPQHELPVGHEHAFQPQHRPQEEGDVEVVVDVEHPLLPAGPFDVQDQHVDEDFVQQRVLVHDVHHDVLLRFLPPQLLVVVLQELEELRQVLPFYCIHRRILIELGPEDVQRLLELILAQFRIWAPFHLT